MPIRQTAAIVIGLMKIQAPIHLISFTSFIKLLTEADNGVQGTFSDIMWIEEEVYTRGEQNVAIHVVLYQPQIHLMPEISQEPVRQIDRSCT